MLKTGQKVSYSTTGICVIESITKMGEKEYYVLKPLYQKGSKVYVPKDNKALLERIRPAIEKSEVLEIIEKAKNMPLNWIEDDGERNQTFKEILSSGDPLALIRLIKCIYTHEQELSLNKHRLKNVDSIVFTNAQNLLHNEIACCLDIKPEEVIGFIASHME